MNIERMHKPLGKFSVAALSAAVAIGVGSYTVAQEPTSWGMRADLQLAEVIPEAGVMTFGLALRTGDVGQMKVRVIGPDGNIVLEEKTAGDSLQLDASTLPDGYYRYEMWIFTPEEPAPAGHPEGGSVRMLLDRKTEMFEVVGGQVVTFDREQRESGDGLGARTESQSSLIGRIASAAIDFVFPSAHAFDCTSPCQVESNFTSELQIVSDQDGSTGGPWSWEFEVDSGNGQIRLGELGGVAEPFKIDFGAPADSILVEANGDLALGSNSAFLDVSSGRFGLGTTTPSETIHVLNTSTPGIRLDDNGEGIWTMQEANNDLLFQYLGTASINDYMSLRDTGEITFSSSVELNSFNFDGSITAPAADSDTFFFNAASGTSNPERMFWAHSPGTFGLWGIKYRDAEDELYFQTGDTNRFMTVDFGSSRVGIGRDNEEPQETLHVQETNNARLLVENTTTTQAERSLLRLVNAGKVRFVLQNNGGGSWSFDNSGSSFDISRIGTGVAEFRVFNNGNATFRGDVTANGVLLTSSRTKKTDFETVDADSMLDKISRLEISEWRYKDDESATRHVGPMAEEFKEVFGMGDGKTINVVDSAGIAFAAIQGLHAQLDAKDRRIAELEAEIESRDEALRAELDQIRKLVGAEK